MSRDFPDWINPWTAAEGRRIFSGTLPIRWMERLVALLATEAGTDGEAGFRAGFSLDNERRPIIDLRVSAELPLVCQASLEIYLEPVERKALLGVVESEADIDSLPAHYEAVQPEQGRLSLARLVEDELLLGMPQIPRRPDMTPVGYQTGELVVTEQQHGETRKPFADLRQLFQERSNTRDTE